MLISDLAKNNEEVKDALVSLDEFVAETKKYSYNRRELLNHILHIDKGEIIRSKSVMKLCINMIKDAIKSQDYITINMIFAETYKRNVIYTLDGGCDHCERFLDSLNHLSYGRYNDVFRFFPSGLPLSNDGHILPVNGTNLLLYLLYPEQYNGEKIIAKAEKLVMNSKAKWYKAIISVLLGIIKKDTDRISENLQNLCVCHTRQQLIWYEIEKTQCHVAYGLLVLAYHNLAKEEFDKIEMPQYKTFDSGYCKWLVKEEYEEQMLFEYSAPYDFLNKAFFAPVPITIIHPSLNGKSYTVDHKSMNDALLDYLMSED